MAFFLLAAIITGFWFCVHLRGRYVSRQATVLPLTMVTRPSNILYVHEEFIVEWSSLFVIRMKTTLFLNKHAKLLASLSNGPPVLPTTGERRIKEFKWQRLCKLFYDIGSLVSIAGQLFALILLNILVLRMGKRALLGIGEREFAPVLSKRVIETFNRIPSSPLESVPSLKPLIPGITVPLSHAFPILLSIIMCTAIHEIGHAISGALDGIPLVSWGYAVILAIPAAFVELSSTNKERSYSSRARIASAGSYHNFITLLFLSLLSIFHVDQFFWNIMGYANTKSGVVVYHVESDSPLHDFIVPGSIITQLDDISLTSSSNYTAQELWSLVLVGSHTSNGPGTPGWCVDKSWFNGLSTSCCKDAKFPLQVMRGSCFHPYSQEGKPGCLDPVPLFEDTSIRRCVSDNSCYDSDEIQQYTCVRPDSSAELLRILIRPSLEKSDQVIVWRGPRSEILGQVIVGRYLPRVNILSAKLPHLLDILFQYVKAVSLSLFFFNLLPVWSLDGSEVLIACLCIVLPALFSRPTEDSLELIDLERGGYMNMNPEESFWHRRARNIQTGFEKFTILLSGLLISGGVLVFIFG